jgi:hypothetical protein
MNLRSRIGWFFPAAFFVACVACGQQQNCPEITSIARIARAGSLNSLAREKGKVGASYRVEVVFAARKFELNPTRKSAESLLGLIPNDDDQRLVWITLDNDLCDSESTRDMSLLDRLETRLPHDLARAVLLAPDKMVDYVAYAEEAVGNPENDYGIQMQSVCRLDHAGFLKAVAALPPKDKDWFVHHIFSPDNCKALILPEAY